MCHNSLYILITLLSCTVILTMGICLPTLFVPKEKELKNYRISRRFLSGAYIFLASVGLYELLGNTTPGKQPEVMAFTLIAASFQSLLFTFSIITLIHTNYVKAKHIWSNVIPISLLSSCILIALYKSGEEVFSILFFITSGLYYLQLVYYITLFIREYRGYRKRFDNFFSGQEYRRLLWIRNAFIMASCIGVAAGVSLFASITAYNIFTAGYTVFYIYFAVKFINYINQFHRIAPVVSIQEKEQNGSLMINHKNISDSIEQWLTSKEYLNPDITLETLASQLSINRTYLSHHINSKEKMNFRQWISTLRITEACRIIEAKPFILLPELAETVGISTQSSFSRQFRNITGITPGEYRKKIVSKAGK